VGGATESHHLDGRDEVTVRERPGVLELRAGEQRR
jgi:hypothetical protein